MFKRIRSYIRESQGELKRVVWPDWWPIALRKELWYSTAIVVAGVIVLAGVIWVYDMIFAGAIKGIFTAF